ncbi:MAG: T9SS type A sorting domain-containing protein [bacterium]|nr:T9SS type A sorting domain-containing protein [bacterium]
MKLNVIATTLLVASLCATAFAVTHKVDPRVDINRKSTAITGYEAAPAVDQVRPTDPSLPGLPMIDMVGDTFRAGRTWYEGQHNGTIGRMLEIDTLTGYVHMFWTNGIDSLASGRQIYYNVFDPSNSTWLFGANGQQVAPQTVTRSGFTTMGMLGGIPFPSFHETNPRATGITTSNVYHDIESGVGAFISDNPMPYVTGVSAIWPRISVGRNGAVHVVTSESTPAAGDPQRQWYHRGVYDPLNTTITWSAPVVLPDVTQNIAAEVTASRLTNKAAIAWMRPMGLDVVPPLGDYDQVSNNVVYVESQDGAAWNFSNFNYITRWRDPNASLLPDTVAANQDTFRAYNDVNLVYSQNDVLYAAFTTGLFYRWDTHQTDSLGQTSPQDSSYYVWGHCWFWRADDPNRITMAVNGGNYWSDIYANPGAWNRTAHRPNLSIAPNGDIYMVYAGHWDWNDSTMAQDVSLAGECNFDIFVTKSTNGGYRWAEPTNITHTRSPDAAAGACWSEHWPSTNRWTNNYVHVSYIHDRDAGFILQTEGSWTLNDAKYHRVLTSSIPATPLLSRGQLMMWVGVNEPIATPELPKAFSIESNCPNPFNPSTDIVFTLNHQMEIKLAVYDIQGRQVAELSQGRLNAGKYKVTFDASDLTSGVYFARLTANGVTSTRKLTLLK